jgi:hypothetical protein
MEDIGIDETRVSIWLALAEHFLDTETRHDIPSTALACVRAGHDVEQAREIWACEVAPAVGFNCLLIAGEWAGWDRDWLVERIRTVRARPPSRLLDWLRRLRAGGALRGVWVAIERCMRALLAARPEEREQMARDLGCLARHYFDFCPEPLGGRPRQDLLRLERLQGAALHVLGPAAIPGEALLRRRRVARALQTTRPPTPRGASAHSDPE